MPDGRDEGEVTTRATPGVLVRGVVWIARQTLLVQRVALHVPDPLHAAVLLLHDRPHTAHGVYALFQMDKASTQPWELGSLRNKADGIDEFTRDAFDLPVLALKVGFKLFRFGGSKPPLLALNGRGQGLCRVLQPGRNQALHEPYDDR